MSVVLTYTDMNSPDMTLIQYITFTTPNPTVASVEAKCDSKPTASNMVGA